MQSPRIQFPVILSAGRATDIPGFYADWFVNSLMKGFFIKRNPYNGVEYVLNTEKTELIVFWTKNPKPVIDLLPIIDQYVSDYYFQFTLNNYSLQVEPGVPNIDDRTETFIRLSEAIGKEKVIWRYDPIFLTPELNVDQLIENINALAQKIHPYTSKLVFSFIDIHEYVKVNKRIKISATGIRELSTDEQNEFAAKLASLMKQYQLKLTTCAEKTDFNDFGIQKNKCIDDELIKKIFAKNKNLIDYINLKQNQKDKGQRKECRCIKSHDIGGYNTCMHLCVYCYANSSNISVKRNYINRLNFDPTIS